MSSIETWYSDPEPGPERRRPEKTPPWWCRAPQWQSIEKNDVEGGRAAVWALGLLLTAVTIASIGDDNTAKKEQAAITAAADYASQDPTHWMNEKAKQAKAQSAVTPDCAFLPTLQVAAGTGGQSKQRAVIDPTAACETPVRGAATDKLVGHAAAGGGLELVCMVPDTLEMQVKFVNSTGVRVNGIVPTGAVSFDRVAMPPPCAGTA